MKRIFAMLCALGILGSLSAAELQEQTVGLFANLAKGTQYTKITKSIPQPHRMAFPFRTSALGFDMYRPVKVDKVTLQLTKLVVKNAETGSGIESLQVFAGNDPEKLTQVQGFKVEKTAAVRKNNVPGEDVTITGLPEARYFQLYVPRTRAGYVFGFEDAIKNVQVYAAVAPIDPNAVKYQPLTAEDNAILANAIAPAAAGFCDLLNKQAPDAPAYSGKFGNSRAGWPALGLNKGRRMAEAQLAEAQNIRAIVLDLVRLNMNMQVEEQINILKKCDIYTSMDGKVWTKVPVDAVSIKFFMGDTSKNIKQVKNAKSYCTRVIWSGKFYGKYFRIDPVLLKGPLYVTGTDGIKSNIKFIPQQQAVLKKFSLPLSASGKVKACINIANVSKTAGKAVLRLKGSEKILWSKDFSELADGQDNIAEFSLPEGAAGTLTATLTLSEADISTPLVYSGEFIAQPGAVILQAASGADKFTPKTFQLGGENITFYSAAAPNAALQYTVPADGKYALIAALRGNGQFKLNARNTEKIVALSVWHPFDKRPELTGEEFCMAAEFKAGDRITFTALQAGSAIGNVKLLPVSDADIALYNAPDEIKPAVILHSDGYSDFYSRAITAEYLAKRIKNYPANRVFCYDFCVGTSAVNYPSKVATVFGQQRNVKFWRNGDRLAAERIKALHDSGINPLTYQREITSKLNIAYSITLRANAFYGVNMGSMNSQFFLDNPQFFQSYPDGSQKRQPSYAFPEVRNFYLGLVKEIAAARPDYLCIEFLRHPPFFGYDKPLIDEYTKRHGKFSPQDYGNEKYLKITQDIMFEYLSEVRRAIDAVDPSIKLAINFDHAAYLTHGLDVERIMQAGLVDMISPGIYNIGYEKYFDAKPFVAMAKKSPRKVEVFPRVECTITGGDPTPEEEKGLVKIRRKSMSHNMLFGIFARFAADGADGMRPFNGGGQGFAKAAANRSEVLRFARFVIPYLDIRHIVAEK